MAGLEDGLGTSYGCSIAALACCCLLCVPVCMHAETTLCCARPERMTADPRCEALGCSVLDPRCSKRVAIWAPLEVTMLASDCAGNGTGGCYESVGRRQGEIVQPF